MNKFERCLDCEAKSHWAKIQGLEPLNTVEAIETIQRALIWILENTDYPVGEGEAVE